MGFKDLPTRPEFQNLLHLEFPRSPHASEEEDFSLPNATDVFGWTKEDLKAFNRGGPGGVNHRRTLDLAGQSVLHHAIDRTMGSTYFSHESNKFRWLLLRCKSQGLLTAKCNKQTPVHRAARLGDQGKLRELLRMRADPNAADLFGRTALCLAAHYGDPEVVEALWEKMDQQGRNRTDNIRRNALFYAVLNHQEKAVLVLTENGIDVNAKDVLDKKPLWYAALNGLESVVESLLKNGNINVYGKVWVYGENEGI